MAKPAWCTKPSPCDYDKGSSYCPHRECRIALESRLDAALEIANAALEFNVIPGSALHYDAIAQIKEALEPL